MIAILIVDDQPLFRAGLRTLLERHTDFAVVADVGDGLEAIRAATMHRPDVVLMDVRMPRMDGVAATKALLAVHSRAKVLALTTFEDHDALRELIAAGAIGYILKDTPADDIADLVRMAHRGYAMFAPSTARDLLESASMPIDQGIAKLSEREREVLAALARGLSNREIAAALFLTEGTVRNHLTSIFARLNIKNRMEAALLANGLVVERSARPSA